MAKATGAQINFLVHDLDYGKEKIIIFFKFTFPIYMHAKEKLFCC